MARIDREELRKVIRDVLREAVGTGLVPPQSSATGNGDRAKRGAVGLPLAPPSAEPTAGRIDSGVLTEARVMALAKIHRKILVGSDVVVTPLARDKAREMRVELVRQKP